MEYENIIKLLKEFDYDKNTKRSLIDFLLIILHYLED